MLRRRMRNVLQCVLDLGWHKGTKGRLRKKHNAFRELLCSIIVAYDLSRKIQCEPSPTSTVNIEEVKWLSWRKVRSVEPHSCNAFVSNDRTWANFTGRKVLPVWLGQHRKFAGAVKNDRRPMHRCPFPRQDEPLIEPKRQWADYSVELRPCCESVPVNPKRHAAMSSFCLFDGIVSPTSPAKNASAPALPPKPRGTRSLPSSKLLDHRRKLRAHCSARRWNVA